MERQEGSADDVVAIPPRPRRGPPTAPTPGRVRAVLRWTAALTALLLAGSLTALAGWHALADDFASSTRPGPVCVARAVAAAQDFAAVLGDTRPVDARAVERSCAGQP